MLHLSPVATTVTSLGAAEHEHFMLIQHEHCTWIYVKRYASFRYVSKLHAIHSYHTWYVLNGASHKTKIMWGWVHLKIWGIFFFSNRKIYCYEQVYFYLKEVQRRYKSADKSEHSWYKNPSPDNILIVMNSFVLPVRWGEPPSLAEMVNAKRLYFSDKCLWSVTTPVVWFTVTTSCGVFTL